MIEQDFVGMLLQGGLVVYPLLLTSIVSVTVIFERTLALVRVSRSASRLRGLIDRTVEDEGPAAAATICRQDDSLIGTIYRDLLAHTDIEPEAQSRRVQRRAAQLARELKRRIWLVGTAGSLAPFIGLLGTVVGIVRAFENMAATGSGGFTVVAAGISEALVATAAGLGVGVVSIFGYNALMVRIGNFTAELRDHAEDLISRIHNTPQREGNIPRVVQSR